MIAAKATNSNSEMQQLEAEIKRLEAEYNMFFAGRLPRLPWETRARVDALVKRYDRMRIANTAQNDFVSPTLQSRFAVVLRSVGAHAQGSEEGRPIRERAAARGRCRDRAPAPPLPARPRRRRATARAERTEGRAHGSWRRQRSGPGEGRRTAEGTLRTAGERAREKAGETAAALRPLRGGRARAGRTSLAAARATWRFASRCKVGKSR